MHWLFEDTDLNIEFSTEESLMAEKHLTKCSPFVVIKIMPIKNTLRFLFMYIRMDKIKTQVTAHVGKCLEQGELSSIAGDSVNLYNHSGNQSGGFSGN